MEELKAQVEQVIIQAFPDAQVELELIPQSEKLSGHVVTVAFAGQSQRERQQALWKLLREHLKTVQQQHLSAILTLSPAEHGAILAYG